VALVARSTMELVSSLGLMLFAFLIVMLSTCAIIVLLPSTLVILFVFFDGMFASDDFSRDWLIWVWVALWFPAALLIAVHNAVVGLSVTNDPNWRGGATLAALSVLALVACPAIWMPW